MAPPVGRGFIQQKIQQLQPRSTSPQKRRRPESGETAETGMEVVKEMIERQMAEFSKLRDEFQGIADSIKTELGTLKVRVKDLEEHTNRKDAELDSMNQRLRASENMCYDLQEKVHANEVISRLPTLIFSGPAVANSAPLRSSAVRSALTSLTRYRQEIFTECLAMKKRGKIYTVFTRYGSVYLKEKRHGYNVRVDDWDALHGLKL